jgi:hypothetical protein
VGAVIVLYIVMYLPEHPPVAYEEEVESLEYCLSEARWYLDRAMHIGREGVSYQSGCMVKPPQAPLSVDN